MRETLKPVEYLHRSSDRSLSIWIERYTQTAVLSVRGAIAGVRLGCFHGTPSFYMTLDPALVDTIAALHAAGRFPHQRKAAAASMPNSAESARNSSDER